MRIRVNKRYYFKWISKDTTTTYFGYFYKHRKAQAWDYDEKMKPIACKFRLLVYSTNGPTKYFSRKTNEYKYSYYDYVDSYDIKNLIIITSKQFNNYMLLYGPKK